MNQTITQNPATENYDAKSGYGTVATSVGKKQDSSFGLEWADNLIYRGVNNFGVYVVSIAATFLTTHGDDVGRYIKANSPEPIGFTVGGFCEWMQRRGKNFDNALENIGMSDKKTQEMTRTVFFSFVDGCIMAPFVKILEDNRGNIARTIDNIAGTTPEDETIYDAGVKQSWGSVLGGRAMTALIVVPVAMALEQKWGGNESLNEKLFYNNGKALGNLFQEKMPNLASNFNPKHIETAFRVSLFEGFYTAVCTEGLRHSSRFLASHFGDKQEDIINANNIKPFVRQNFSDVSDKQVTSQITLENPETLILANNKLKLEKLFEANELSYQR
jgi:hypothetical protein